MKRDELAQRVKATLASAPALPAPVSPADVDSVLARVDVEALQREADGEYTWEIWDKRSPINGIPAEEMIRNYNIAPDDVVFLLRNKDGLVELFQPVAPGVPGNVKMNRAQAEEYARAAYRERVEIALVNKAIATLIARRQIPAAPGGGMSAPTGEPAPNDLTPQ